MTPSPLFRAAAVLTLGMPWCAAVPATADPGGTATVHVSASGSDQADGGSGTPWRTIQKAADSAPEGATILVNTGVYEPFTVARPHLTIKAAPDSEVVVRGRGDVRDVVLLAAGHVTLSGITVEGCSPDPHQGASARNGRSGIRVEKAPGVTVSGVTVRDSHGLNAEGLPIGCYGVIVRDAWDTTVENSEVLHNGYGIAVVGGRNTVVRDNRIHDNDVIVHNTAGHDDDDYGAVGIGFLYVSEGATAQGNTIFRNEGPSVDYETDGGAFDIFQSSHVTIAKNLLADNEVVLETGTDPGGDCVGNVFEGNIARGRTTNSTMKHAAGILLRCAQDMAIRDNDLRHTGSWMFQITGRDRYAGSLQGLDIRGNTVAQDGHPVFQLDLPPKDLGVTVDGNSYRSGSPFAFDWNSNPVPNLAVWQQLTGWDASSGSF